MTRSVPYLEANVAMLDDDQLWALRKALSKGREWLDSQYELTAAKEAEVAEELGRRIAGEGPKTYEVLQGAIRSKKHGGKGATKKAAAKRTTTKRRKARTPRTFNWKEACVHFMDALEAGMTRSQWLEAIQSSTDAEYSKYQVNAVLDILRGRGRGEKAGPAQVVQEGTRNSTTYRAVGQEKPTTKRRPVISKARAAKTRAQKKKVEGAYKRFGNVRAAAEHLGMAKSTFADLCKKHDVDTLRS